MRLHWSLSGAGKTGICPVPAQEWPGLWPWCFSLKVMGGPGWPCEVNLALTITTNCNFEILHFPGTTVTAASVSTLLATLVLADPGVGDSVGYQRGGWSPVQSGTGLCGLVY